jgi:SagB-type dehydrogenase family enzyme
LRTAPSAGALYPIETYLAVDAVDGLKPGLYHLNVFGFHLERLNGQTRARDIARAALDQSFIADASVVFIWSAILRRTMSKYGHRGIRYIFMDAGHICQNLLLAAQAMDLSACPVAALYENELNSLLGLDGEEETVIYIAPVGVEDKKITV